MINRQIKDKRDHSHDPGNYDGYDSLLFEFVSFYQKLLFTTPLKRHWQRFDVHKFLAHTEHQIIWCAPGAFPVVTNVKKTNYFM